MSAGAFASAAIALWLGALTGAAAPERLEIVIGDGRLEPPVLQTTTEQRVTFVNRSSRMVHVQFLDEAGRHHVFQVPGSIWAVFYRPGRHPYVVHFPTRRGHDLLGVVEVEDGPARTGDPPTCAGVSVMGVCLEP
jgi:hypothetical protein